MTARVSPEGALGLVGVRNHSGLILRATLVLVFVASVLGTLSSQAAAEDGCCQLKNQHCVTADAARCEKLRGAFVASTLCDTHAGTCAEPGHPTAVIKVPTPTLTPAPICTPQRCRPGEILICPGSCPGGCGRQCATHTPAPTATATATASPSPGAIDDSDARGLISSAVTVEIRDDTMQGTIDVEITNATGRTLSNVTPSWAGLGTSANAQITSGPQPAFLRELRDGDSAHFKWQFQVLHFKWQFQVLEDSFAAAASEPNGRSGKEVVIGGVKGTVDGNGKVTIAGLIQTGGITLTFDKHTVTLTGIEGSAGGYVTIIDGKVEGGGVKVNIPTSILEDGISAIGGCLKKAGGAVGKAGRKVLRFFGLVGKGEGGIKDGKGLLTAYLNVTNNTGGPLYDITPFLVGIRTTGNLRLLMTSGPQPDFLRELTDGHGARFKWQGQAPSDSRGTAVIQFGATATGPNEESVTTGLVESNTMIFPPRLKHNAAK